MIACVTISLPPPSPIPPIFSIPVYQLDSYSYSCLLSGYASLPCTSVWCQISVPSLLSISLLYVFSPKYFYKCLSFVLGLSKIEPVLIVGKAACFLISLLLRSCFCAIPLFGFLLLLFFTSFSCLPFFSVCMLTLVASQNLYWNFTF